MTHSPVCPFGRLLGHLIAPGSLRGLTGLIAHCNFAIQHGEIVLSLNKRNFIKKKSGPDPLLFYWLIIILAM